MAIDWDEAGSSDEPIPLAQLEAEAELLQLVKFWREKHERLADEKDLRLKRWRRQVANKSSGA